MAYEKQALAQFDRLVEDGELLWKDVPPRNIPSTPFNVSTRTYKMRKTHPPPDRIFKVSIPCRPQPSQETHDGHPEKSHQRLRRLQPTFHYGHARRKAQTDPE